MDTFNKARVTGMTVLAASLALAFGQVWAEEADEEILRQILPDSTVRLGLGYLTEDAARFGQYNGIKDAGMYVIGDIGIVRRDPATGTWLRLDGRDLGFESRDLRFEHSRQGDWRYFVEYGKTPRFSPYTATTRLQGIGSTELRNLPTTLPFDDVHLKTVREAVTVGGDKALGKGFAVQVRFKNETKEGTRLFGRGNAQFLAEPIDQTTRQLDVILAYTGEKLQLSGGYYGSIFENDNKALWINRPPIAAGGTGVFSPISLPPDNHAHQFHLAGGYTFTPTTRGNFKVSRGVAYQNDDFMDLTGSGQALRPTLSRTNLGGKVVTTQAQVGLSSRPMPKLSLLANLRYMDRDDQTPIERYVDFASTGAGENHPRSVRVTNGKVEASYRLPQEFKLTGGIEHETRRRNTQEFRSVGFRRETREESYRIELGRSLSETLNGSIAYIRSERDGSSFYINNNQTVEGVLAGVGSNLIAPLHLADRDRDKVRLKLDWTPLERLSLQLMADFSEDEYGHRALAPDLGLDKGSARFWSVDAAYTFTDDWQGLAWVSRDYTRSVQRTRVGANPWTADLRQIAQAFGLGVRGNLGEAWKVGGDIQYQHDRSDYLLAGTPANNAVLPDVKYTLTTLKLFAEYAMQRDLALRVEAIHDQWSTNDWNLGLAYADGTRLSQDRTQETTFIGVSMRYNWR